MKIDINPVYCCTLWFPVLFFIPWIPSAAFTGSSLITRQGELNKVALKGSHLELPCSTETFTSYDALFQWRKDGSLLISSRNSLIKPQHEIDGQKPSTNQQQVPSPGLPVKTFLTTSDHRISISSINGSLKINNVTYKDEGLYLCETFNYFETTLLKITLYVIEPHPRHHRYHSHVQRPYHSQEETPVAYLPILSISLVISFFLIINCYKKESSPHIPDLTETSRLSSFFSRTCKGHQSFLLTKAATLPASSLPLMNGSKGEGNTVESNSDNNNNTNNNNKNTNNDNTRIKQFEANFQVQTSTLATHCGTRGEPFTGQQENVYMYEQVKQNGIFDSSQQNVLQSMKPFQQQNQFPCQYQREYQQCYQQQQQQQQQQCQPSSSRYLANCENDLTVKSQPTRLTSSLSTPILSTCKSQQTSLSEVKPLSNNDNHYHKHYSTSEIFINFCSKIDSINSSSPSLVGGTATAITSSKSFWSESGRAKCSSTCLTDVNHKSIINDSDYYDDDHENDDDDDDDSNNNSCNVDNNFINSSNSKMTNITRNPVCLGYKINEKFINCVDESFFERESTHSSGPSSPTSLLSSSNSLVPLSSTSSSSSSSSSSFSYGQTNNIFSKQSDHLKPRITYFDSIVVYRSDSGDISDFISSFVS